MLKTTSIATLAVALSVSCAWADGVSLKDAPSAFSMGGVYFGGMVGYGWGTSTSYYNNDGEPCPDDDHPLSSNNPSGMMAGVTVGYNHRLSDKWVVGVEGDLAMSSISGEDGKYMGNWDPNNNDHHVWYSGWGSLFTLRARAGYEYNGILFYGTLGYAAVHSDEYILGDNADQTSDNRGWRTGWAAGVGVERQFTDRISGKIEYLHVGLTDKTGYGANGGAYMFENDLDMIRMGLNYKLK